MPPLLGLFCLIIDRLTKRIILNNPKVFLGKLLELELSKNQGLFSFAVNQQYLIIITLILILIMIFILSKNYPQKNYWQTFSFLLIIGGGASNLYDRMVLGYVIDFIKISLLPFSTFNLADVMIVGGIIGFIVNYFFLNKNTKVTADITKETH